MTDWIKTAHATKITVPRFKFADDDQGRQ
jgi:hypothetical protein